MTILWVTFGVPYPPDSGVRMRDYHLIREVAREARVILFCIVPPGREADPGDLRDFCARIEVWPMPPGLPPLSLLREVPAGAWRNYFPAAAARIRDLARDERPDIFQIEHSLIAAYRHALHPAYNCRTLISLHNVAGEQYRKFARLDVGLAVRFIFLLKSVLMNRAEAHFVPRFDCCIAVSPAERDLVARRYQPRLIEVVENGVDSETLRPLPRDGNGLIFPGVMDYPPNSDAAEHFCRSILPRIRQEVPESSVAIVGHNPPPRVQRLVRMGNVSVTGRVDDIRPYYAQASICIVPLRAGGGTRLKILEAMALGRPVVSTSIGCEGLEVEHNRHLLIADSDLDFADCVVRLLRDRDMADRLSAEARRLVEERYDWRIPGRRLLRLHADLAAEAVSL